MEGEHILWKVLNTVSLPGLRTIKLLFKIVLTVIEEYVLALKFYSLCCESFCLRMSTSMLLRLLPSSHPPACGKAGGVSRVPT